MAEFYGYIYGDDKRCEGKRQGAGSEKELRDGPWLWESGTRHGEVLIPRSGYQRRSSKAAYIYDHGYWGIFDI